MAFDAILKIIGIAFLQTLFLGIIIFICESLDLFMVYVEIREIDLSIGDMAIWLFVINVIVEFFIELIKWKFHLGVSE